MTKTTIKQFKNNLSKFLTEDNKPNHTIYVISTETEVTYGHTDCNVEYCKANNIPCYDVMRNGGCIVHSPGNISVADYRPIKGSGETIDKVLTKLQKYLLSKGINAYFDNNDLMVDGKKVASSAVNIFNPDATWKYTGIQISINNNKELIDKICLKPRLKEPGALSDYGITTEEIVKFLKKCIH